MTFQNPLPPANPEMASNPLTPVADVTSSQWFSFVFTCVFILAAYAVVITGVRVTETRWIIIYALGIGVIAYGWSILSQRIPGIGSALRRERQLLAVGALLCAVTYPFFATGPYQLHVMVLGGIFAIMGLGLNVTIGFAGLADFGYVAYYAIGAYTSALLNVDLGLNFWICLPLAGLVAAALSLLVAFPAIRVKGHYLALVTLGFAFIVIQMITNLEVITGGTKGVSGIASPVLLGHSFRTPLRLGTLTLPYEANFYYLVLALIAIGAALCLRLGNSRWGRAWAAMRGDEVAAAAAGLDIVKLKLLAFCTGASFGGIAGSIYAHMIGYIDPSTFPYIESVFLIAIVALGNWRVTGVIIAAVLVTLLPEKLRAFDEYRLLIFSLCLLVVMLVRGRRMLSGRT